MFSNSLVRKLFKTLQLIMFAVVISTAAHAADEEVNLAEQYVFQQGDVVSITVYQEKDLSGDFEIDVFGKITFPLIGEVQLSGLRLDEAKNLITDKLSQFLVNPQVTVLRKQTAGSSIVTILGEVSSPGTYPYTSGLTLMSLIAQAKDLKKSADTANINLVLNKGKDAKETRTVSINDILEGKIDDVKLGPGDVVKVPELKVEDKLTSLVTLIGAVIKPGTYDFSKNLTLLQLLATAGGANLDADTSNIRIIRTKADGEKEILTVNRDQILEGAINDFVLQPTDVINVPLMNKGDNTVTILGEITKSGTYEYKKGLTLLMLIAQAQDLKGTANPKKIKIIRYEGTKRKIFIVNLYLILNGKIPDIALQPNDVINIPESFF